MSIANYKKPKLSNPYSPIYSPISIHSVKKFDIDKNTRSVSFYNPKRRINNSYVMNRSLTVSDLEHSLPPNENVSSSRSSPDTSNSTSIFNIVQSVGKTLFSSRPHTSSNKLKRYSEKGYLFITNKQRKLDLENRKESHGNHTPNVTSKKVESLTFSKDPFGWDKWKTTEFGKDSNTTSQSNNYGTTFIRRDKLFNRSTNNLGNDIKLIKRGYSREVSYLRQIFNGEYQIPKIIADERENQLRLIDEDKKLSQEWLENELKKRKSFDTKNEHSFKKSIIDLTERIKHVLLNHQPSNKIDKVKVNNEDNSDDLIFIKERKYKQASLQRKREKYLEESERFRKELLRLQNEFKNYKQLLEERKQIQNKIKKQREEEAKKQREQQVLIPNISDKDLSSVKSTLQRHDNAILFSKDNIEVTIRDFKTLAPRRWLNDTIIEFFMKYIEWNVPQTVAFNSFFYSNLSQRGYQGVRRWMKRKKVEIKNLKKIFVPINLNESHWALGFIDIQGKRIIYVDSLSQGPSSMSLTILNNLKSYVIEESKNTIGEGFELIHSDCPQQPNGFDCGIYVCMNALYLSKDSELTFTSKDAVNMRNYIGHLILKG